MVVVNTSSGATHTFELRDPESLNRIFSLIQSNKVTALSILFDGSQHVLPTPKKFRVRPVFGVELVSNNGSPVAERIYSQIGDIRLSITRTFTSKLTRCDLTKIGFQRFSPNYRGS